MSFVGEPADRVGSGISISITISRSRLTVPVHKMAFFYFFTLLFFRGGGGGGGESEWTL